MKRTLAWVALVYAAGLMLAQFWHPPLLFLFSVAFALTAGIIALRRLRVFLVWPLIALIGWTNLICHTSVLTHDDLRNLLSDEPQDLIVRGTLAETPDTRLHLRDAKEEWRTLAKIKVTALGHGTNWQTAHGEIITVMQAKLPPEFFGGEKVEVAGIIAPPPGPVAEGLFDYQQYLRLQGIYYQLKADSPDDWHLLSTNQTPPISDRFLAWAKNTMARGLPEVDEQLDLLWAMTLGWRAGVDNEMYEPFKDSGTMHIFAISGLHIALLTGILMALLRVVQIPRLWCGLVIIPLLWFYTAVTGWQPSAVRSTIMMSIIVIGWSLKRPTDLLTSLSAAGLIILLCDPQQLFQASFQLSFFVVLSIALFLRPLEKIRDRLLQGDPLLPPQLLPRWKRWSYPPIWWLLNSLTISFAACLGAWPLVAYYFHIFSPVTLLANLLIVPLSSFALACNLGSLLCGSWLPFVTELFNHSAWFWMSSMIWISKAVIKIPGAFFYVSAPTAADFVIYYSTIGALLMGVAFKRSLRWLMIGCVICIIAFYGYRWQNARHTTTLSVLPLNGGSAVFVQSGNRANNLLMDCGDTNSIEFVTLPFLQAHGVNRLSRFALTEGDLHNIGGALQICDAFPVEHVFTSSVHFRSSAYRRITDVLDKTPNRHVITDRGDSIGNWAVLYPTSTNHFSQADDNSMVLQNEFYGIRLLLLSNLGTRGQNDLLETTNDLHADIVVTGLPEQSEPVSDALLNAIDPRLIVIADSELPATRRASERLQYRLEQRKIPILYTRDAGMVKISVTPKGWTVTMMNGGQYSGKIVEK
ncbi:MAG TPA: ComEC/Rec2 family competence protein [Verrucomicrobiae bacterium]|nr:ComEC/Rec2 family competence protein [Verrucomicrobiae bacterium]